MDYERALCGRMNPPNDPYPAGNARLCRGRWGGDCCLRQTPPRGVFKTGEGSFHWAALCVRFGARQPASFRATAGKGSTSMPPAYGAGRRKVRRWILGKYASAAREKHETRSVSQGIGHRYFTAGNILGIALKCRLISSWPGSGQRCGEWGG